MNIAIKYDPITGLRVTDNNEVLTGVLASLARNNTFFPNIKRVSIKESENSMSVYFKDGTWVTVKKSDEDENDYMAALMYAMLKRLFGKPTKSGYVHGEGFMGKIKNFLENADSETKAEAAKEQRIADKIEADRRAHEAALARRKNSVTSRLDRLEEKFEKFLDSVNADFPNKKSRKFRDIFK